MTWPEAAELADAICPVVGEELWYPGPPLYVADTGGRVIPEPDGCPGCGGGGGGRNDPWSKLRR